MHIVQLQRREKKKKIQRLVETERYTARSWEEIFFIMPNLKEIFFIYFIHPIAPQ
jgi:hypothetical protein